MLCDHKSASTGYHKFLQTYFQWRHINGCVCVPYRSVWGISFAVQNLNHLAKGVCLHLNHFSFILFLSSSSSDDVSRVLASRTCICAQLCICLNYVGCKKVLHTFRLFTSSKRKWFYPIIDIRLEFS